MNFAVCFILIFTPMIISGLVAGVGMGSGPSLAGAVVTRMLMNYVPVVRNAAAQTAGIVKGGYRVFQNPRTPTTSGKFKAAMTGTGSSPSAFIKKTTDNKGTTA
jgi:hypothetical protein